MSARRQGVTAPASAKMVVVEAVILRAKPCPTCGYGESYDAQVCRECGTPLEDIASAEEDQGRIAFWHKNPLRRLAWRAGRLLGKRKAR